MGRTSPSDRFALPILVVILALLTAAAPASAAPAPVSSAAAAFSWGTPAWCDEFDGEALAPDWSVYDSPGHDGNGVRSPTQVAVADGVMTQTGTADARSAGMLLQGHDERRGRWEFRMRATQRDVGGRPYHLVVALLPVGVPYEQGERDVDLAEADLDEDVVHLFVHHPRRKQAYDEVAVDMTAWHTYAVEVAGDHLTWFVDGRPEATVRARAALPTTPLAVNVQLDAYAASGLNPGLLQLDWVRYYPLPEGPVPVPAAPAPPIGDYAPGS